MQEYSLKQHKESIHENVKPIAEDLPYSCMKCPKKFGDTKSAQTHFLEEHLDLEEHLNLEDDIEMHIEKIYRGQPWWRRSFRMRRQKRVTIGLPLVSRSNPGGAAFANCISELHEQS